MIEPIYRVLGANIGRTRKQRGRTQQELADGIGLHRVTVANIEIGRQRVYAHHLVLIARYLRTTPQLLFRRGRAR